MDLSKLTQTERLILAAASVVVVTALLSLSNSWGLLMGLSLLGGLGAIAVVLQPQLAPGTRLPTTRAAALVALGAVTTVATFLTALNWVEWIFEHLGSFDTLQFLVGLGAAAIMLLLGFSAYQAERVAPAPPAA